MWGCVRGRRARVRFGRSVRRNRSAASHHAVQSVPKHARTHVRTVSQRLVLPLVEVGDAEGLGLPRALDRLERLGDRLGVLSSSLVVLCWGWIGVYNQTTEAGGGRPVSSPTGSPTAEPPHLLLLIHRRTRDRTHARTRVRTMLGSGLWIMKTSTCLMLKSFR